MTFVSVKFFVFIIIFLATYKIFEFNLKIQNKVLLIGNYVFYSLIDIRFCIVLFLVSIFTSRIISNIQNKKSKTCLIIGILVNVAILMFFKYIGLLGSIFSKFGIIMPVGLSFYIFESISLLVDSYNGKIKEKIFLNDVLLYLSFFPIVISGPIVKGRDFLPQIHKNRFVTSKNFAIGIQRFILGMFEKVVIADRLSVAVNAVYSAPAAYSGVSLLCNTLSYSMQLFFDFAGYSNMAIGVATIIGFCINENFNLPYIAKSPSDFWKRWHISLSLWITEYIYIPMGGNKKGKKRTLINIMLAMIISGIWHGSTLNFVLWGALHGLAQVIEKYLRAYKNELLHNCKFFTGIGILITFIVVNFLWIPFRTDNLSMTLLVFKRIMTNEKGLTYIYNNYSYYFDIYRGLCDSKK